MQRSTLIVLAYCNICVAFANLQHRNGVNGVRPLASVGHATSESSTAVERRLPSRRGSLLNRITFNWVSELMETGNRKTLQVDDMWAFEEKDRVANLSDRFSTCFEAEKLKLDSYNSSISSTSRSSNTRPMNLIQEFWDSPVTKAIVSMYREQLIQSGVLKFFNTMVQFLPSLIIARLLKGIEGTTFLASASAFKGFALALSLFIALSTKTFLENQYFYTVIDMGASIRGALSAAIYRKVLKLSPSGRNNNTVGEIVNYMQIDTNRMEQVAGTIHVVWDGLFQIIGYTGLLLYFLGPSVFAGIAAMLVILPLNAIFLKKLSVLRLEILKHTDTRVKLTNEILQGVRAIKSYNWEQAFLEQLTSVRSKELNAIKQAANTRAILVSMLSAAPSFVAVVSLSTYALLGNLLTPVKVFTALGLFNQLRFPLTFFPLLLNTLAEGNISLKRLTSFLSASELQNYVQNKEIDSNELAVTIQNANFSWTDNKNRVQSSSTLGRLTQVDIKIRQGDLVAIVGPVGSGKSTLMSALLGELYLESGAVSVSGKIAYVSQSAWIPNDSLQDNVLFGNKMNRTKYDETLKVCSLSRDIELLEYGDQTEIGERGVNLSGGQKQRVSMARAVYEDADIYLLDDPLSALDSQVGSKVFKDCIKGKLRTKTRLLVTNQLSILPEVDRIILLAKNAEGESQVLDQGSFSELLSRGHDLSKIVQKKDEKKPETLSSEAVASNDFKDNDSDQSPNEDPKEQKPTSKTNSPPAKLMTIEERGEGVVSLDVYKSYLKAAKSPALLSIIVLAFILANSCQQFQQWIVAAWTTDVAYTRFPLHAYLIGITSMASGVAFFNWLRTYFGYILGAEASETMHHNMAKKVLGAPLSYFESTPLGRLIQRFTKDLDQIDQQLPGSFGQLIASTLNIMASMVAIVVVTPSFALVLAPLIFVYMGITNYYRGVARELKRLDSLSRSPVFAHLSETVGGLSTIRSFQRQNMVRSTNEVRLEDNLSAYYALKVVDRWLSVRLELLGNIVVFFAALLAVWSGSRAGPSGLSLNNALSTTSLLNWAVRNGAETESLMNSVERVLFTTSNTLSEAPGVVDIYIGNVSNPQGAASNTTQLLEVRNDSELLQNGWPWQGGITFSNGFMRYREDFQPVLKGVNIVINPGESIGIVGRTGSGKSSLFRALLRLTELEGGSISIDGVDIRSIGLNALRSSIAIIPQDPMLFSGSVR